MRALVLLVGFLLACDSGPRARCLEEDCHVDLMMMPNANGGFDLYPMTRCTCRRWEVLDAGGQ